MGKTAEGVFKRREIPVNSAESATPGKLKRLNYLDCIAGYIAKDDKVSVHFPIDANCVQAL